MNNIEAIKKMLSNPLLINAELMLKVLQLLDDLQSSHLKEIEDAYKQGWHDQKNVMRNDDSQTLIRFHEYLQSKGNKQNG
jgi:hypothetical protein